MKQLARGWRRALGLVLALALVFSYAPATIAYAEDPEGTAIVADGSQEAAQADVQEDTQGDTQEELTAPTPGSEVVPSGTTSNDNVGDTPEDEKKPEDENTAEDENTTGEENTAEEVKEEPTCTCGAEGDVHTEGCPLYVAPTALEIYEAALADMEALADEDDPDPDAFLAAQKALISAYDALSDEEKDTLPEDTAEMIAGLQEIMTLELTGAGTEDDPYIISDGRALRQALSASTSNNNDPIYFQLDKLIPVNQATVTFYKNTVLTGNGGIVRGSGLDPKGTPLVTLKSGVLTLKDGVTLSDGGFGGVVLSVEGGTANLEGGTIENTAEKNPYETYTKGGKTYARTIQAAVKVDSGSVNVTGTDIKVTGKYCRSIWVEGADSSLVLENVEISNPNSTVLYIMAGTAKITDSTIDGSTGIDAGPSTANGTYPTVEVSGAKITAKVNGITAYGGTQLTVKDNTDINARTAGIVMVGDGTDVKILDSTVISEINAAVSGNANIKNANTLLVERSTLTSTTDYYGSAAIFHPQGGTVTIRDSQLSGFSGISMKGGTVDIYGKTTITGIGNLGQFDGLTWNRAPIDGPNGNGSAIQIETNAVKNYSGEMKVYVHEGVTLESKYIQAISQYGNADEKFIELVIDQKDVAFITPEGQPAVEIEKQDNADKIKVQGSVLVDKTTTTWVIGEFVAQILDDNGDVKQKYTSLHEAVAAANKDDRDTVTIEILKDFTETEPSTIAKNIQIDGQGHTITLENGNFSLFDVVEGGNLSVTSLVMDGKGGNWSVNENGNVVENGNSVKSTKPMINVDKGNLTLGEGAIIQNFYGDTGVATAIYANASGGKSKVVLDGATIRKVTGNGFGVALGGPEDAANVQLVLTGNTQIVENCSRNSNNCGGIIRVAAHNGSLTIEGNTEIAENHYNTSGLIALQQWNGDQKTRGKIEMTGGSIHNNYYTRTNRFGGIFYIQRCDFTMTGGSIYNNRAGYFGVIVVNSNNSQSLGHAVISGGQIYGNTDSDGTGSYVGGLDGTIEVSEGMTVTGDITMNRLDPACPTIINHGRIEGNVALGGTKGYELAQYIENETGEITGEITLYNTYAQAVSPKNIFNQVKSGLDGYVVLMTQKGDNYVYTLTIKEDVSITLDKEEVILRANFDPEKSTTLVATTTPTDAVVTWTSSDPAVATVNENGLVTAVSDGTVVITATVAENVTATCQVTVNTLYRTVTFNSNGGTPVTTLQVANNSFATAPTVERTGYTLGAWQLNGADYDFTTPVTSNLTLTARWNINRYTVTFNANGGSAVAAQTVDWNTAATRPANPNRAGYTFGGWRETGATANYDFTRLVTGNLTLTAQWTAIPDDDDDDDDDDTPATITVPDEPTPLAPTPVPPVAPVAPVTPVTPPTVEVEEPQVPLEPTPEPAPEPAPEVISVDEPEVPLAAVPGWSLVNLLLMIATTLVAALRLIGRKKEEETDDGVDTTRSNRLRLLTLVPAVGSLLMFFLNENLRAPMVMVNNLTVFMVMIAATQAVLTVLTAKKGEDHQDANPA